MGDKKDILFNPFFRVSKDHVNLRFHVFGPPQTPIHSFFSACALSQQTRLLCWGLKSTGHTVYHYGNERSVDKNHPEQGVVCDEHVSVTTEDQLMDAYPSYREDKGVIDYLNPEFPHSTRYLNEIYILNTEKEVRKRSSMESKHHPLHAPRHRERDF